jgi:hypothetical protein
MGLCALLFGVLLAFAVQGVKLWRLGADKVDVNESALVALHVCQGLLQKSDIESAYLNPNGVNSGMSFLSAVDTNGILQFVVTTPSPSTCAQPCPSSCASAAANAPAPQPYSQDGYLLWQKWQILYFDSASRTLRLGEVQLSAPSIAPQPFRLTDYSPSLQDRILAKNIDSVQFSTSPQSQACAPPLVQAPMANPIYVQVTASRTYQNQPYETTLQSAIVLENGFTTGANIGEAACNSACSVCPACIPACLPVSSSSACGTCCCP